MHRSTFLSWPASRLARTAPLAAGLALAAAVVPAGMASAAALPSNCSPSGTAVTCTFGYTGGAQAFTVPAGVQSITVTTAGAQGGSGPFTSYGGLGGEAQAAFTVAPRDAVQVLVGGQGGQTGAGGGGGFNGGAAGGAAGGPPALAGTAGGGGGGASDVRTGACASTLSCGLAARVLVGGGGGGSSQTALNATAGGGGWPSGGKGGSISGPAGGGGGSQYAGGLGGVGDRCGFPAYGTGGGTGGLSTQASGGGGGTGATDDVNGGGNGGGGGGGGYWGGGGGGGGCPLGDDATGGGGSSFGPAGATFTNATQSGNGQVTISYANPLAATATVLASSGNPSAYGQPVAFTATVNSAAPPGTIITCCPGGTVTFSDGGTPIGTATLDASGRAGFTTKSLAAGTHMITASYGGAWNFTASTSAALTQTVNQVTTTITGGSSPDPSVIGGPVTYTATVSPAPDGGTVAFGDMGTTIPGCGAQPVDASTGTATCPETGNAVGLHWITAAYSGDATYAASASVICLQVVEYNVQLSGTAKAYHSGAKVPIALQLLNAAGTNLSTAGIPVTVTGLSPSPAPGTAPAGTFTFLSKGPGYQLSINTAGYPAGTYTLSFTAGSDPTVHTAQFAIS